MAALRVGKTQGVLFKEQRKDKGIKRGSFLPRPGQPVPTRLGERAEAGVAASFSPLGTRGVAVRARGPPQGPGLLTAGLGHL